ncbi:ABC transporter ATP-binding protein [Burkholderia oklahomensis]|uniref:ABC transporter ATP-binding protein n=1 Tax=Burkholderia oklahomensis TaxID=342113 RepID=UPI0002E536FB|nr:ATP-binding cassette domain-containing protein [Burkholderia oklahomensis]AJX30933.1 ABC transporter family protein [Burkholderia oklahomensis C6786]AOI44352.1 branched-chain amino acid ABC transporter ATP-binding protein [Burkholderia oklahomensis C6786]KUY61638.1 branched-chain amino acid ABC transporter ATP-binding protein [Burkholderia oklahomensis C6786]MBI0359671.1 ATP-binding cassette domain-containing protein [Burkholderia oklahomensis]MDN7674052.1 ATP-binding cassette domain-contai
MIEISNLTVQFGGTRVLDALDATLGAPVCGLIGPNGAGKTTLLNVLSGFLRPRAGSVALDGRALLGLSVTERVRAGVRRTFQTEQIVEDLSVHDNVLALAEHVIPALAARNDTVRALELVGLDDVAHVPGAALNLYQRRMLELGKALVGEPRLLLLDEPGAGLNEAEAARLRDVIVRIPELTGAQVLLIDHDVDLIDAVCEQTLVLDFGKRLALGPTRAVLDDPLVRSAYLGKEVDGHAT